MEIPLTQDRMAQIDPEDWPLIAPYSWYASHQPFDRKWYAVASAWDKVMKREFKVKLHRVILGAHLNDVMVDHKNGDTLDCRRANLRLCDNALNQQNSSSRGGSSQFKCVSWNKRAGRWRVMFNYQGQTYFVGYFDDEVEAAKAYNAAILPLAGEFARMNFQEGTQSSTGHCSRSLLTTSTIALASSLK